MSEIEKAKLYKVSGPIDRPKSSGKGISVMFNPTSLKVTLANAIGENERNANSRAAQYVDKSSSSLTMELIFDTSDLMDKKGATHLDVRKRTGEIANEFMKQEAVGNTRAEPKRCMFAWGTFVFVGIMESFDETLDFFSWEGTPLRATVSIKMSESRFQYESDAAKSARRNTPRLGRGDNSPQQANTDAGQNPKNWRDTSLYNGIESPRLAAAFSLAVPSLSLSANLNVSAGVTAGTGSELASKGFGAIAPSGRGPALGTVVSAKSSTTTAFSFGASSSLGTGIPGAFSTNTQITSGFTAGSMLSMSVANTNANASTVTHVSTRDGTTTFTSGLPSRQQWRKHSDLAYGPTSVKANLSLGFD